VAPPGDGLSRHAAAPFVTDLGVQLHRLTDLDRLFLERDVSDEDLNGRARAPGTRSVATPRRHRQHREDRPKEPTGILHHCRINPKDCTVRLCGPCTHTRCPTRKLSGTPRSSICSPVSVRSIAIPASTDTISPTTTGRPFT